jgi:hypothetical protein
VVDGNPHGVQGYSYCEPVCGVLGVLLCKNLGDVGSAYYEPAVRRGWVAIFTCDLGNLEIALL